MDEKKTYCFKEIAFLTYGKRSCENMLIHGDNREALNVLREKFAGKIKCIYMDPPYCSGTRNEHYSDIFEQEEYLKMMREILTLSYELLSDKGFLFIQIGRDYAYAIRGMGEDIFKSINFRNEIIIGRDDHKTYDEAVLRLTSGYDVILLFSKRPDSRLPILKRTVEAGERKGYWKDLYRSTNHPQYQYSLCGVRPHNGEWRWAKQRADQALYNYSHLSDYAVGLQRDVITEFDSIFEKYIYERGITTEFPILRRLNGRIEYYVPPTGDVFITDNWSDLNIRGHLTDFEHEVNEEIIRRIIGWATGEGDIILDPFLGSGTSAVVAAEMKRKWIGIERENYCRTDTRDRINGAIDRICKKEETLGYRFMEIARGN